MTLWTDSEVTDFADIADNIDKMEVFWRDVIQDDNYYSEISHAIIGETELSRVEIAGMVGGAAMARIEGHRANKLAEQRAAGGL